MMALSSPLSSSLAVHGVGQTFLPSLKKSSIWEDLRQRRLDGNPKAYGAWEERAVIKVNDT